MHLLLERVSRGPGEDHDGYSGCVQQERRWYVCSLFSGCQSIHVSLMLTAEIFPCSLKFFLPDPSQMLQVADAFCVRLSSRDLLGNVGDDEGGESREKHLLSSSGCQMSDANPLLIFC